MPSTRNPGRWNTPSAQTRELRSSSQSTELTQPLSQASTPDAPIEEERTDTIRTRLDIGAVDTEASQWHVGMIVQIPHVVPTLDPNEKDPNLCVYTSNIGNVCPKVRKAIVVQVYNESMIVLPVYSSHQRGIIRKPEEYRLLAMSVSTKNAVNRTLNLTAEVLIVRSGSAHNWEPCDGSHIKLNEPVACKYAWPIKHVGSLDRTSTGLLQRRHRTVMHMGYQPVHEQMDIFTTGRFQDQAKTKLENAPPKHKPVEDAQGFRPVEPKRRKK